MFVPLEIGSRGDLTAGRAQAAATFFKQIEERVGPGCIYAHLAGYDSDPRALWDIPEAADYVRLWAHLAGLDTNSAPAALHEISLSLLLWGFGRNRKRLDEFATEGNRADEEIRKTTLPRSVSSLR